MMEVEVSGCIFDRLKRLNFEVESFRFPDFRRFQVDFEWELEGTV